MMHLMSLPGNVGSQLQTNIALRNQGQWPWQRVILVQEGQFTPGRKI